MSMCLCVCRPHAPDWGLTLLPSGVREDARDDAPTRRATGPGPGRPILTHEFLDVPYKPGDPMQLNVSDLSSPSVCGVDL